MGLLRRLLLILLLVLLPGLQGALAQQSEVDFEAWRKVAVRAEEAIANGRASDAAMDVLRGQLVDWQTEFGTQQSQARISINSLETRLETLGPKPEAPETEPEAIAALRQELTDQLAQARVPIVKAEIAEAEATNLIEAIDALVRERQTSALLKRGASPIDPDSWHIGLHEIRRSASHVAGEIETAWIYERKSDEFVFNAGRFVVLFALGLLLVVRGGRWTSFVLQQIHRKDLSPTRWLVSFALSLGYVVLPLLGVFLLIEAVYVTALAGLRGDRILSTLPFAAFLFLAPVWIGNRIFAKDIGDRDRKRLPEKLLRRGRIASVLVGMVMALFTVVQSIASFDNWAPEARSAVVFPLLLAAALIMLQFARLFRANVLVNVGVQANEAKYYNHFLTIIARFYQVAAIGGVLLALVGYTRVAEALIFPAIYTVQLVAFLALLHRMFTQAFSIAKGGGADHEAAMWPLVLSFFTTISTVPLLLLIWGMRPQDVAQFYEQFLAGFKVGEVSISPSQILLLVAIFSVGFGLTRLVQAFLRHTFLPRTRLDVGGQNAVVSGTGYVGITLAAIIALNNTGIDLGSIALVASALSIGIGFGLQTIVSNFVSGIILLIERPIAEGDWIEVNGQMGYVRDISVRSTRIETFDRTDVIVPNGDLVAGTVTNYTRGDTVGRVIVPVGVAYGTDPRLVEKILLEVANAHPMVLAAPPPNVIFQGFGASSLDFEIRAILRDVNWVLSVRSDMNYEIARRFMEEGIEIPFPQQDIWLRNPETLRHPVQVEPMTKDNSDPPAPKGQSDAPEPASEGDE